MLNFAKKKANTNAFEMLKKMHQKMLEKCIRKLQQKRTNSGTTEIRLPQLFLHDYHFNFNNSYMNKRDSNTSYKCTVKTKIAQRTPDKSSPYQNHSFTLQCCQISAILTV